MAARRTSLGTSWGELELLGQIRRRAAHGPGSGRLRLGIGDDCALLAVGPGQELAVTTDLSIAGRHFQMDWHPPESVGHRTLARGLSDLASMGAQPMAAFLSLGVPPELTQAKPGARSWVDRFYDGLLRLAAVQRTPLAGGDLAESPVALADIVLIGRVPAGRALLRSGARPGDLLYVTGVLGAAAAGFAKLAEAAVKARRRLADRPKTSKDLWAHLFPQPRIAPGLALLRRRLATAAIDLSDGLSTDLAHLCEESGVGAMVQAELLPVAHGASLDQALHGGEDYELLFAARPSIRMPRSIAGVPVTRIGETTLRRPRDPAIWIATHGKLAPLKPRGWEHFSSPRGHRPTVLSSLLP